MLYLHLETHVTYNQTIIQVFIRKLNLFNKVDKPNK